MRARAGGYDSGEGVPSGVPSAAVRRPALRADLLRCVDSARDRPGAAKERM
ncbi:hypothetical protein GCM10009834_27390 [Streptomonospora arabica]